ncbi:MAG: hypothetical protein V1775_13785, partial [Bacteroidota bacterium]
IVAGAFAVAPLCMFAQPNPGGGSGGDPVGGDPIGGGQAPIGGGVVLLVTLASAYGLKKVYQLQQEKE